MAAWFGQIKSNVCEECAHLEVGWVHPQSEGVQLAEAHQAAFQVVHFANGIADASHDDLAVLLDRSGVEAQVIPVGKVGLGLGVDIEQPAKADKADVKKET